MNIIHMPTSTSVSFGIPATFKTPNVGQISEPKFEDYINDPEE